MMNNEPDYDNLYFERANTMTQKIFDTDNAEDMALLWSILPDDILRIYTEQIECFDRPRTMVEYLDTQKDFFPSFIAINWHDKTEIIRPIQEATEADVGKLCAFWDSEYNPNAKIVGCLNAILPFKNVKYVARGGLNYKHCRRLTQQEIEELC